MSTNALWHYVEPEDPPEEPVECKLCKGRRYEEKADDETGLTYEARCWLCRGLGVV
jgi:hypothetical protein